MRSLGRRAGKRRLTRYWSRSRRHRLLPERSAGGEEQGEREGTQGRFLPDNVERLHPANNRITLNFELVADGPIAARPSTPSLQR